MCSLIPVETVRDSGDINGTSTALRSVFFEFRYSIIAKKYSSLLRLETLIRIFVLGSLKSDGVFERRSGQEKETIYERTKETIIYSAGKTYQRYETHTNG